MQTIDYVLTSKGNLSLAFEGKSFTVNDKEERFKRVFTLADLGATRANGLTDRETVELRNLLNPSAHIEKSMAPMKEAMRITVVHGVVLRNGEPLHNAIARRIAAFVKEGLPYTPLLKFMERCEANPSPDSVQELYDFLDRTGLPITPDGHFLAYKGVNNEFRDCHTNTFDNSPGKVHELTREEVDPDRRQECSYGFHAGAYPYAAGFGTKVMRVKIDPADAVAVPLDHNAQKLRTRKYIVLDQYDTSKGEMPSPLYGENGETFTKASVVESAPTKETTDQVTFEVLTCIQDVTGISMDNIGLADTLEEYSVSEFQDESIFALLNKKFGTALSFSMSDTIQEIVDRVKAAQAHVTSEDEDEDGDEDGDDDSDTPEITTDLDREFGIARNTSTYPVGGKAAKVAAWYMDQLTRDDLCRYAAKRGVVKSAEEARRIGKAETAKKIANNDAKLGR